MTETIDETLDRVAVRLDLERTLESWGFCTLLRDAARVIRATRAKVEQLEAELAALKEKESA